MTAEVRDLHKEKRKDTERETQMRSITFAKEVVAKIQNKVKRLGEGKSKLNMIDTICQR